MEFKDIVIVAASIVVGLGSAWMTAHFAKSKAESDRKHERQRALREYERVLADVFHEWTDDLTLGRETNGPPYSERIEAGRAGAWPYLHDFPEGIRPTVKFPLYTEANEIEGLERVGAAAQAISDYLDHGRRAP